MRSIGTDSDGHRDFVLCEVIAFVQQELASENGGETARANIGPMFAVAVPPQFFESADLTVVNHNTFAPAAVNGGRASGSRPSPGFVFLLADEKEREKMQKAQQDVVKEREKMQKAQQDVVERQIMLAEERYR